MPPEYALPPGARPVGPAAGTDVAGVANDCEEALTAEVVVGVGAMTGAEVGDIAGVETGFAGAAVFWKQAQALDSLEAATPTKLLGIFSLGDVRNLGQNAAASVEKRSRVRSELSS